MTLIDKTSIKRVLIFTAVLVMCFVLGACGKKDKEKEVSTESDAKISGELTNDVSDENNSGNGESGDGSQNENGEGSYVYVTQDNSVGLGKYEGLTYTLIDTSVTQEQIDETMTETLEYFQSIMEIDELTDDVIAEFYDGYETVEELKAAYSQIIEQNNIIEAELRYQEDILNQIVENSDVFVDLTDEAAQCYSSLVTHYNVQAVAANMTFDEYVTDVLGMTADTWEEKIAEDAATLTYRHTVLLAIAEAENITISDAEYESKVGEYMDYYGYDNLKLFEKEYTKEYIITNMLEDSALEYVMSTAIPADNF